MMLSTNFCLSEFACKCGNGCEFSPELIDASNVSKDLVLMLQRVRDALGHPITITSGLRCKQHNAARGGDSRSGHITGVAVDLAFSWTMGLYPLPYLLRKAGFKRIGFASNFIHVDILDWVGVEERVWRYDR